MEFLWVGIGGAAGAVARYGMGTAMRSWFAHPFPIATFAINVLGSFAIGLLFELVRETENGPMLFLLLGVGFLGGFTTFSAFSLETLDLVRKGEGLLALGYALSSGLFALGAVVLGVFLGRVLRA